MVEKTLLNNIRPFTNAEGLQKLKNSAIRNCCIKMLGINIAIMPKVYNFISSKVSSTKDIYQERRGNIRSPFKQ